MGESGRHSVVLGAGGHASVVIEALQLTGVFLRGVLDPKAELHDTTIMGVPVLGGDELLEKLRSEGVTSFVLGVGSIGRTPRRRRVFESGLLLGLVPLTVIHPSATCSKWASLGGGTVVLANAVVNANARIGLNAIINSGAIVEHGCAIGDHTHVASGARVLGDVQIGGEVFIGAGATVKQGVVIGSGAVVGAGAVVLKDVGPGLTVAGVPARVVNPK